MARFILLLLYFFVILATSKTTVLHCDYHVRSWPIVQNTYHCTVNKDPNITTIESAYITSMSTNHQSGKRNSDIEAFHFSSKTAYYFPRGLDRFFKNLVVIDINNCNLKEVYQQDLKPFTKLIQIFLYGNKIEVLEEGLFDYNTLLEFINIGYNKLVHIEPLIFDHLSRLSYLYLDGNTCINEKAEKSVDLTKTVIQSVKSKCQNSEFTSLKEKLENFESESITLSLQDFNEKLILVEKSLNSLKFSSFRPISSKLNSLRNPSVEKLILIKTSKLDSKFVKLDRILTKISTNQESSQQTCPLSSLQSIFNNFKAEQNILTESISKTCTKASIDEIQENVLNSRNEMKSLKDKIKADLNKNINEKLNLFNEKNEEIKRQLKSDIEKELAKTRHKITLTIDEKINGIEKRLMKKIEKILEDKLAKFVNM